MWTAKIISKTRAVGEDKGRISVELLQDSEIVTKVYIVNFARDVEWLKLQVTAEVAKLEGVDLLIKDLALGPFNYTPTPPKPPTQEELDAAEYQTKYKALGRVKAAITDGLLTELDADVVALKARLQVLFKKEYLGL